MGVSEREREREREREGEGESEASAVRLDGKRRAHWRSSPENGSRERETASEPARRNGRGMHPPSSLTCGV